MDGERGLVGVAVALLLAGIQPAAAAASGPQRETVTARAQSITTHYEAYAEIEPIAALPLRAAATGFVAGLNVVPGAHVEAGQKLAELGGPEVQALLTQREGAVESARARLTAAKRALAAERDRLRVQLSTRQSVAHAQSEVAAASAALASARAQLRAARRMHTLRAPAAGIVTALAASDGQRVAVGQTVLTLQASDRLWLKAAYYGADAAAIRVGMTGRFQPASGGTAQPVKVAAVFGGIAPDGAESIGLLPAGSGSAGASPARWRSGEAGRLTLDGAKRSLVSVPTRALILDRAEWWVLLRTPQGDRRQAVVPGPARGWDTFLLRGVQAGQRVVVQNAFLEFHAGISERYQPPD